MLPRVKDVRPLTGFRLYIVFDDGEKRIYDVKEDIDTIEGYKALKTVPGLFEQVKIDLSRTCVFWNEDIDLPSDTLLEYGKIPEISAV